jgi:carbon storage regulator
MLVLSRTIGEKLKIGDEITVEVRRVVGNRVALAIDAPRHIRVLRGELKPVGASPDAAEETNG